MSINDSWKTGDPYEYFMGRWSRLVTLPFLEWLSPSAEQKWLDVGCGSGVLCESIINNHKPDELTAIDQSVGFIKNIQDRLGNQIQCKVGNAIDLPIDDDSVHCTVSGLVLNFISNPIKALTEMKRATMPGGKVAIYIWDYTGKMEFLNYFWDTAVRLDPKISNLHEGRRFPDSTPDVLEVQFGKAGFIDINTKPIEINTHFKNFDDYWKPFLGGQGPAPTYLLSMKEEKRCNLRDYLIKDLPVQTDGSIPLIARAWAIKGTA